MDRTARLPRALAVMSLIAATGALVAMVWTGAELLAATDEHATAFAAALTTDLVLAVTATTVGLVAQQLGRPRGRPLLGILVGTAAIVLPILTMWALELLQVVRFVVAWREYIAG